MTIRDKNDAARETDQQLRELLQQIEHEPLPDQLAKRARELQRLLKKRET